MDIFLLLLGFILMLTGILGSFLPVLPGTPVSWVGLLLLYLTSAVPNDWWFLGITLVVALVVFAMDYIIPAVGTRKFGGTRSGMIGTTLGLVVAIIFPVLGIFGIVFWPFLGAFLGELLNKADQKSALKAAFGSFIGFLTGTFLKFVVTVIFFGLFIAKAWEFRTELFPWFN
ncbi:DUF456 domain-containing protein [Muriicola marianensis]|uniref:Membrane protein n=1 Tax=Muriicola marianensis TaxID=1324801 RepID=A0ABQ1QUQ1_9FLAO|nr:DUF456 domain-containing protein [Muriicola marianensis]GGD47136.1 membrane protein [Muriicola marianensis]